MHVHAHHIYVLNFFILCTCTCSFYIRLTLSRNKYLLGDHFKYKSKFALMYTCTCIKIPNVQCHVLLRKFQECMTYCTCTCIHGHTNMDIHDVHLHVYITYSNTEIGVHSHIQCNLLCKIPVYVHVQCTRTSCTVCKIRNINYNILQYI